MENIYAFLKSYVMLCENRLAEVIMWIFQEAGNTIEELTAADNARRAYGFWRRNGLIDACDVMKKLF